MSPGTPEKSRERVRPGPDNAESLEGSHEMKGRLACVALLVCALTQPALAATKTFYVPLIKSSADVTIHSTSIWISNPGTQPRTATARLLEVGKPPQPLTAIPTVGPGRTTVVLALPVAGILEIVADDGMAVEARSRSTASDGKEALTAVPVITQDVVPEAKATTQVLGLQRDPGRGRVLDFGVVNLGNKKSVCDVTFYRADGSVVVGTAKVEVAASSVAHFSDAFAILGESNIADARAQVSCDQPFFPYGALLDRTAAQHVYVGPSQGGTVPFEEPLDPEADFVFRRNGQFHTSTVSNPKAQINIPVNGETQFTKVVFGVDFRIGGWNNRCAPTNHNIMWLYRNQPGHPFRSNSLANVNAFLDRLRNNQNIDLPPKQNTNKDVRIDWKQDVWYSIRYTYDARASLITVELREDGSAVAGFSMPGSARSGVITVPSYGLKVDFGHLAGQHCPEVNSIGWDFRNFYVIGYTKPK